MAHDNTNRGAAWKKEKKSDKSPSYSGNLNVGGVEYEIAVWRGQGDGSGKGKPDITFLVKPKGARSKKSAPVIDNYDDFPPF
jgi:hypothetical protein